MELRQHGKAGMHSHPIRIIEPSGRAHAAVALILEEKPDGLHILFIKRATNASDLWSGQIGFPGGRSEKNDKSPKDTAERETREELGLDLSGARYLGRLGDVAPGGLQMVVSCFVYAVGSAPVLHPEPREVAGAFWFPFREISNRERCTHVELLFRGRPRRFPALRLFDGKEPLLWGISYRMLRNLDKVITCGMIPTGIEQKEVFV